MDEAISVVCPICDGLHKVNIDKLRRAAIAHADLVGRGWKAKDNMLCDACMHAIFKK